MVCACVRCDAGLCLCISLHFIINACFHTLQIIADSICQRNEFNPVPLFLSCDWRTIASFWMSLHVSPCIAIVSPQAKWLCRNLNQVDYLRRFNCDVARKHMVSFESSAMACIPCNVFDAIPSERYWLWFDWEVKRNRIVYVYTLLSHMKHNMRNIFIWRENS